MNTNATRIATLKQNLATLSAFVEKYGDQLERVGSISTTLDYANFFIFCHDDDRERKLVAAKEIFGTANWTAITKYDGSVDWETERLGVKINIDDANAKMPTPPPRPVSPREWPIMIEETATA